MSLNNYTKMSAFSLICLLGSISDSSAQWPTLDVSAIFQDAKSIVQQVQQYKTQIEEAKTTGAINAAIGDAASSMGAFNMDKIEAAKKKAEKAKKKAEKIQKVKEKIQKAKEEYKKKKEQYDKYKKKVAEAKEMFNEAKDLAATAKTEYNSIKSQASAKVSSTVSQASNKLTGATTSQVAKIQEQTSSTNSSKATSNNSVATPKANTVAAQASAQQSLQTPSALNKQNINSPVSNNQVSRRTSFSTTSSTNTDTPQAVQTTDSKVNAIKATASTQGSTAGTVTLHQTLNRAIEENDVETLDALADMDTADIINSDSKVYDETEDSKDSTPTLVPALSRTKPALQTISNTATTGGRKAFSAPQGVITTDEPEARDEPVTTSSSAKLTPKTNVRLGGGGGGRVEDIVSTDHDSKSSKQLQAVKSRL